MFSDFRSLKDLDVVNPHVPEKKHKRSEFVESLENFKFDMNPSFSFYNSIDVPSTSQQLAWPDLLTAPTTDESSSYDLPAYSFDLSPPPALAIPTATAVSSVAACAPLESDVNHVRIQQLKSKEQAYRDTLQKLYEEYNPGNALDEVQQVEECVRGELSSIDSMLEQSVLKVDDLFCALSLKDKYQRVLHHCSILESEELYHMDDVSGFRVGLSKSLLIVKKKKKKKSSRMPILNSLFLSSGWSSLLASRSRTRIVLGRRKRRRRVT